jgi:hypothetical protein
MNYQLLNKTQQRHQVIIPKYVQLVDKMMHNDVEKTFEIENMTLVENFHPIDKEIN